MKGRSIYKKQTTSRHGHCAKGTSATYKAWCNMHQRCNNPKNPAYHNYGGRGIQVCERWFSFDVFLEDMGEKPERTCLDRIDANGMYSPDNCRRAGLATSRLNTRTLCPVMN
jgi:hypothetical protein